MSIPLDHLAVKVPLLLVNLHCSHICTTAPNPAPKRDEQNRYESDAQTRDVVKNWASWYTPLRRNIMHSITLIELLLMIASAQPSLFSKTPLDALTMHITSNPSVSRIRITAVFMVGSFLIYVATAIRLACYRELGRHFTFQLAILPGHKLITSGPYSIVRHPSYTASTMSNLGVVLCQVGAGSFLNEVVMNEKIFGWGHVAGAAWVVAVTAVSYMLIKRIPREDLALRKEFGAEWDRWAQRTKYRLIPGIY